MSRCPKCKKYSRCGCESCLENFASSALLPRTFEGEYCEVCPHCKASISSDAWLDEEVQEMKENGTWWEIAPKPSNPMRGLFKNNNFKNGD